MTWLVIVAAAIIVVLVALVAVGGVTQRLSALPPERVFDLDEAIEWVAERLDDSVTAELSFEDVRMVIEFHLDYLEALGVAREDRVADLGAPGEWAAQGPGPRVADEVTALGYVLGQLAGAERDVSDAQAAAVIELCEDYLGAIGAFGEAVPDPGVLEDGAVGGGGEFSADEA